MDILVFQRLAHLRVGQRRRAFLGLAKRPGGLLEFKRTTLANPALVGVGEAAAVEHHAAQARRMQAGHRQLGVRRVRKAHAADLAVAPWLADDPGQGVETVFALGSVFGEHPFGGVAPATILEDCDKALGGKAGRHLFTGNVLAVELLFRARRFALVIGRTFDHHRIRAVAACRQVDVGGQVDAIAHGDHLVVQGSHR